jgi:6-phosphogluconolactonase
LTRAVFFVFFGGMKYLSLVSLSLLLLLTGCSTQSLVYFGTYTTGKSKGIYVSRFNSATGKLTDPELVAEIENPTFLTVAPGEHFLYAVREVDKIGDQNTGGVKAYAVDAATGKLTALNEQNSGGAGPCHISVDATGKTLLVANYGGGSIAAMPIHDDGSLGEATSFIQHTGSSVNTNRQTAPHAHSIYPSPDNRFALNCDLGLDKVFAYRLDPASAKLTDASPPFATVAPGSGPRHLVFSGDGKFVYVINEIIGTITVFSYDAATAAMTEVQTISSLPKDFTTMNTSAEIALHPSGKFLYASNRGHDSIALFSVDQKTGMLTFVEYQSVLGKKPRHFTLDPSGRWLIAENQDSDSVVVFSVDADTGKLKPTGQTLSMGAPVCAVFVGAK